MTIAPALNKEQWQVAKETYEELDFPAYFTEADKAAFFADVICSSVASMFVVPDDIPGRIF